MYNGSFTSTLTKHFSNIPGFSTKRRIIVIESDDWGSIRMPSKDAFSRLLATGISVDQNHYTLYDSLECNSDLEILYETLTYFKDSSGRNPVITAVSIVANPDFYLIKQSGYGQYYYESFEDTLKKYPSHDNVMNLYREGMKERLFVPVFHGREHLNVQRWLRLLQQKNNSLRIAFENQMTGITKGLNGEIIPDIQAAFDIDYPDDIFYLKEVIDTGLDLFKNLFGFPASYFVPANGPFNNTLEKDLKNSGIKYVNTGKRQIEPLGNGKFRTNFRFQGKQNSHAQIYLTRNCFFEPSAIGKKAKTDWVGSCLKEIDIAFRWNKPATISTHRVNFAGYLSPENRSRSITLFRTLLKEIIRKWPQAEFLTSVELGELIRGKAE